MEPLQLFELVIAMLVTIIALHYVAHRLGLPPAVALLTGGALLAFLPGLPVITLDPESVLARCEAAGVEVVSPMEYVPYGVPGDRGFTIRDPEGNLWAFGTYGATPR